MENNDKRHQISVTVGLPTATVFDVRGGLNITKGSSFSLKLENFNRSVEWFADNDNVLDILISEDSLTAKITALEVGDSEIEIQFRKNIIKLIKVVVVEGQDEQATGFTVTVDPPVVKIS